MKISAIKTEKVVYLLLKGKMRERKDEGFLALNDNPFKPDLRAVFR